MKGSVGAKMSASCENDGKAGKAFPMRPIRKSNIVISKMFVGGGRRGARRTRVRFAKQASTEIPS
jgi:hypothetical protein